MDLQGKESLRLLHDNFYANLLYHYLSSLNRPFGADFWVEGGVEV